MEISNALGLAVALGLAIAFLLLIWSTLLRRRRRGTATPDSLEAVSDAKLEEGERPAALVSEQIEEMVKNSLSDHPDLSQVKLDFGTAPNGTLQIWVDGTQYESAEAIPDERIRDAIASAVRSFNR